jgi:RNA recognition motif-containing protein
MFIPSQIKQFNAYNTAQSNRIIPQQHQHQQLPNIPPPSFSSTFISAPAVIEKNPVILTSAPKLYTRPSVAPDKPAMPVLPSSSSSTPFNNSSVGPNFDMNTLQFDVSSSKVSSKKMKTEKSQNLNAQDIVAAAKASSALQSFGNKDKRKIDKKTVRQAGGITWEDHSLLDFPEDDFRIFCGDLGNDVNDELLTRTFSKFPSFQKAKVIRDKRTNKTKGYGFISFKEPADFIKAMKEFDGRCLAIN